MSEEKQPWKEDEREREKERTTQQGDGEKWDRKMNWTEKNEGRVVKVELAWTSLCQWSKAAITT